MKHIILLMLAGLAASACATTSASRLPVCDGKHLRPANPNGSVLDVSAPAASSAVPAPTAPTTAPSGQPDCGA